jgi:hypothetical protein
LTRNAIQFWHLLACRLFLTFEFRWSGWHGVSYNRGYLLS